MLFPECSFGVALRSPICTRHFAGVKSEEAGILCFQEFSKRVGRLEVGSKVFSRVILWWNFWGSVGVRPQIIFLFLKDALRDLSRWALKRYFLDTSKKQENLTNLMWNFAKSWYINPVHQQSQVVQFPNSPCSWVGRCHQLPSSVKNMTRSFLPLMRSGGNGRFGNWTLEFLGGFWTNIWILWIYCIHQSYKKIWSTSVMFFFGICFFLLKFLDAATFRGRLMMEKMGQSRTSGAVPPGQYDQTPKMHLFFQRNPRSFQIIMHLHQVWSPPPQKW